MFRTIIVPLDGTGAAEAAVPYAAEEAQRHGAQLVVLQVISQPESSREARGGPLPIVYVYPEEARDCPHNLARRYLCSVVDRYQLEMKTIISIDIGDPYLRLEAAIERYPAPLVVMAVPAPSRDRTSVLAASLAGLLRETPAPMLVVRGSRPIRRIAEVPVAAGVAQSRDDQPPRWELLTTVDARVARSN
jgi:nucleotide-binding universal stress UspA family protein